MNLFVIMASTPGLRLQTVGRGVVRFLLADVVRMTLLMLFPFLSLWLPSTIIK
jgi:TRAP-type C4-dicarboxylate transport system permease large subunit